MTEPRDRDAPIAELTGVTRRFGAAGPTPLDGVDLSVAAGESVEVKDLPMPLRDFYERLERGPIGTLLATPTLRRWPSGPRPRPASRSGTRP